MEYNYGKLKEIISDVTGDGKLLVIQPGGNYGDYLIYEGFDRIMSEISVDRIEFSEQEFRHDGFRGSIPSMNPTTNILWLLNQLKHIKHRLTSSPSAIYIHGGGNFNDIWSIGVHCYQSAARFFNCPIIVGPQSCRFNSTDVNDIFKNNTNETYFFCREEYSYEIIKNNTSGLDHVNTIMSHDTALYLDRTNLPLPESSNNYTLLAFRPDRESCDPTIRDSLTPPIKSRDISQAESSYHNFIAAGENAEIIHTDRLHGAILGVILNKTVKFYDNSYHKNRGVYEHSLANNAKVEFKYVRG